MKFKFGKDKNNDSLIIVPKEDIIDLTIKDLTSNNELVKDLTTDQVFQIIKQSVKFATNEQLKAMLANCIKLKDNLEITGQKALLNELTRKIKDIGIEYEAIEAGYKYFIYKKDVRNIINAVNKTKGFEYLQLTPIESYMKLIPPDSNEVIKEASEIFKLLLVLHTDPNGEHKSAVANVNMNKKDKDPILFGSTSFDGDRLYLICSWQDEFCQYTLTDLMEVMAEHITDEDGKLYQIDIPTTIEELVGAINKDNGIWKFYKYDEFTTNTTITSTSTPNITRFYKEF